MQKRTFIVFMTSFYCLRTYKGGGGVSKSPNLRVRALWMVPKVGTKLKSTCLIKLPDYTNLIKSFELTSSSK